MRFELMLEMPNANQEAVWLEEYIEEHGLSDLEIGVQQAPTEPGTMDAGVWTNILVGIASGVVTNRIEWLIRKLWERFRGSGAKIKFQAKCPENGKSFEMIFDLSSERARDAAEAEFKQRYATLCGE